MDPFYAPPSLGRPGEVVISPWSYQSLGVPLTVLNIFDSSQNYVAVNVGVFVPFTIPEAVTFTKLGWGNGSAVAGNLDVGLFAEDGTMIVAAGITAQLNTTTLQVVDITDTTLARGRYYLGLTSDTSGITQKVRASLPVAGILQALGLLQDSAAAPPFSTSCNPATFVAYAQAFIPVVVAQGYRTLGP